MFSNQLWRHPPLFMGFGLLLAPLKQGFELRMQLLTLGISTAALLVFLVLAARLFGKRIALLAGIAYILLPGPFLFDTWIKRDPMVTLFCLTAILAFFHKQDWLAGIFLGLGFLSKETSIFFAAGFIPLIMLHRPAGKKLRACLHIFVTATLTASWWYLIFANNSHEYVSFFKGSSLENLDFNKTWWFYFAKLRLDLGWTGLLLFTAGIFALLPKVKNLTPDSRKYLFRSTRLLPLFMLLPGYAILTFSQGKPAWMTTSLYPFLCLLVAIGWSFIHKAAFNFLQPKINIPSRFYSRISLLLFIVILALPSIPYNRAGILKSLSPGSVDVMRSSYEMVQAVNSSVHDHEKLMLMPMLYRTGPTMPDPIFYWNLKPINLLLITSLDTSFTDFKNIIVENRVHWVLMSPIDGSPQEEIFRKTSDEIEMQGYRFTAGVLIRVDNFWKGEKTVN